MSVGEGLLAVGTGGLALPFMAANEGNKRERMAQQNLEQENWRREENLRQSKGYLEGLQFPTPTEQTNRRIAALESEGVQGPLATDPYFQGERSRLLHGGARELAAVQNRQAAGGLTGGFRNIGSEQDIQDRMGTALSSLAQQSQQRKSMAQQQAADMSQALHNAEIAARNHRQEALAALYSGDTATALASLRAANAAAAEASRGRQKLYGDLFGMGITAAAAAAGGGPAAGPAGQSSGNAIGGGGEYQQSSQQYAGYGSPYQSTNLPPGYGSTF